MLHNDAECWNEIEEWIEAAKAANTMFHNRIGARKFVNDWNSHAPAHHCAVGIGHSSSKKKSWAVAGNR
jgi:L-arabinose isomerase